MALTQLQPIAAAGHRVTILDQTLLPHEVARRPLRTLEDAAEAIATMRVRGAPLIGITAAYGLALAMETDPSDERLASAAEVLRATRPTGVNLHHVVSDMTAMLARVPPTERASAAVEEATRLRNEDVALNRSLGNHGLELIEAVAVRKPGPVQVLTHCNAGVLATAGYGTATAPIYRAQEAGIPIHVWVDETRPRNQGASLTAWEFGQAGVPHTVIVDNAGGLLMQRRMVDLCLVGTDRTLVSGDVFNKIGTYLKALAAHDNGVPFYVAVPGLSIDWDCSDAASIPIEERDSAEVSELGGVRLVPEGTPTSNFGFDLTPARLVTGLITERGVCEASSQGLRALYPEFAS